MRRRLQVLLLAYLVVLGVGVFGPAPGDGLRSTARELRDLEEEARDRIGGSTTASSAPVDRPWRHGSTRVAELRAEEPVNALVFVPIGFLVPLCWPRLRWVTVLLGAQLSGLVELIQDVFLDSRSPRIDDVRWNTLGAAVGFGLWLAVLVVAPGVVRRLSGEPDRASL